ncbi:MAG TPA: ATP-binding protein, partial [Sediminispirochaeta sp.]|nr:ATP-binding protein [Sediminispirochaeta sp.]
MDQHKEILIDGKHPLFDKTGMFYKEFASDYRQVRFISMLIVQKAPAEIKEINLLEQQISELIKNAVRHGNKKDPSKKVKVWASFSTNHAHLIVQDEGEGFQEIEKWNEFNRKRNECFETQNFEELENYFSYRTEKSTEEDGG